MGLRTVVGRVQLEVWHGQDPQDKHWGCPIRDWWGLKTHQQMSPALEEKLAFTATQTLSYEAAARVASKWSCEVDDSVIHAVVQRVGSKAEDQMQGRLEHLPQESDPQREATELGILMVDGWYARFRGPGWGKKRTKKERVEWHEMKTGIFYRHEQAGQTHGGRGIIADKVVVRWQGEPLELGRRLHWEALRGGLGRARDKLFLGDGIAWIWNLKSDRWAEARELLDFWHGGQHLWGLGRAHNGMDETKAKPWVEERLHQLRHGQEQEVLKEIGALKVSRSLTGKTVQKEKNYFANQSGRMNHKEIADRGWPIGSGPVESTCRGDQCRFKRPGQFWTPSGLRCLSAGGEPSRVGHI
jgi:hypothetical protein